MWIFAQGSSITLHVPDEGTEPRPNSEKETMRTIQPLTKRQREIYDFIAAFIRDVNYAPSLEEIGVAMNLSSLATVHKHLDNLQDKGYITRLWNRGRSIALTMQAECCPTCGRGFEKRLDEAKVSLEIERKSAIVGSAIGALTPTAPTTTEVP